MACIRLQLSLVDPPYRPAQNPYSSTFPLLLGFKEVTSMCFYAKKKTGLIINLKCILNTLGSQKHIHLKLAWVSFTQPSSHSVPQARPVRAQLFWFRPEGWGRRWRWKYVGRSVYTMCWLHTGPHDKLSQEGPS